MLGKRFYQYFYYWRSINKNFNIQMNTKVKDRLIKLCRNKLRLSFTHWKEGSTHIVKKKRMMHMEELK
jgi:hypothetical protein